MPDQPAGPIGWLDAARRYARHPELMLPFLLQGLLGGVFSWAFMAWDGREDPVAISLSLAVALAVALGNLVLQGWAFPLCARALGQDAPGLVEALALAGRRVLRLLGLAVLAAVPATALFLVFESLTTGWVQDAGVLLTFTLTSWLVLLGYAGVFLAGRRAWPALRDAFLLLGAAPQAVAVLFSLLLAHSALDRLLSGSLVLVGVSTLDAGRLGAEVTVAWTVLNVLWLPLLYLWLVAFYRNHQPPEEVPA